MRRPHEHCIYLLRDPFARASVVLGVVAIIAHVPALLGFLCISRGNPLHRIRVLGNADLPGAADDAFPRHFMTHVDTYIEEGNDVDVVFEDAVFPRLFDDLSRACDGDRPRRACGARPTRPRA